MRIKNYSQLIFFIKEKFLLESELSIELSTILNEIYVKHCGLFWKEAIVNYLIKFCVPINIEDLKYFKEDGDIFIKLIELEQEFNKKSKYA